MKKITMAVIVLIIICSFVYLAGYTHGYKTAGHKYYYDGMRGNYDFVASVNKINQNYQKIVELGDFIYGANYDTTDADSFNIYNNKIVNLW